MDFSESTWNTVWTSVGACSSLLSSVFAILAYRLPRRPRLSIPMAIDKK